MIFWRKSVEYAFIAIDSFGSANISKSVPHSIEKGYIVHLSEEEQPSLKELVSTGKAAAYKIKHANILLSIDVNGFGWTDEAAANAFHCHRNTVANIRQRLVEQGLETALERKPSPQPPRQRVCDGESEVNRSLVWRTSCGSGSMDITTACRQSCGVGNCACH